MKLYIGDSQALHEPFDRRVVKDGGKILTRNLNGKYVLIEARLLPSRTNPFPCMWNTCGLLPYAATYQIVGSLAQTSNRALLE